MHDASHKRPVWSRQINNVSCSIWRHDHEGESRHSVSITRSYFSKKSNEVKRGSYFDLRDLVDVIAIARDAETYIRSYSHTEAEPHKE